MFSSPIFPFLILVHLQLVFLFSSLCLQYTDLHLSNATLSAEAVPNNTYAVEVIIAFRFEFEIKNLGVKGSLLKIVCSYLNQKKQFVTIDKTLSETLNLHSGVPQGSLRGLLLFIIYINISSEMQSKAFGYADGYKYISTNQMSFHHDLETLLR